MVQEICFPTKPDLADIVGRTDMDFEESHFSMFWIPVFWNSSFPDYIISKFPDAQTPAAAPAPDKLSDPNLSISQGIQGSNRSQGAKSPCCDEGGDGLFLARSRCVNVTYTHIAAK